jgi:hypothetical protein
VTILVPDHLFTEMTNAGQEKQSNQAF